MRIYSADNTIFNAMKTNRIQNLKRLSKNKSFTNIKPIKNYSQYIKEYGLQSNKSKNIVAEEQINKGTI